MNAHAPDLKSRHPMLRIALMVGILAVALTLFVGYARAEARTFGDDEQAFGVHEYTVSDGSTQASSHSDFSTQFTFNVKPFESGETEVPIGQVKDIHVNLPAGLVGNPDSTPRCTTEEFELFGCKPATQIGLVKVHFDIAGEQEEPAALPLYNITPAPGHLATFASSLLFVKILMQVNMRSDGSNGLVVTISDFSTLLPVGTLGVTLWGVPASSTHDLERSRTEIGGPQGIYEEPETEFGERKLIGIEPTPAGVSPTAFLTNSSDCTDTSATSTLEVDSWQEPSHPVTSTAHMPTSTGCQLLSISPSVVVSPETRRQDTPTGYDIDLSYPLSEEPFSLGTPDLQKMSFTLPPGTSLSPGVSNGLVGCSDEQFNSDACPNESKVGAVAIDTPVLPDPLVGSVYIGTPEASAMYRVLLVASADNVTVRVNGVAHPDPATGQVTIDFESIPQLPFDHLDIHLFGGAGAVFANPPTCGTALTTTEVTSYAGQTANPSSSFNVNEGSAGGPCQAPPFSPSFDMGTLSAQAGASSPFTLTVSRSDGQQTLSTIKAQLPPGLLANLSGVPQCSEAQAATGECPPTSQIGTTTIGSGAGAHPLWLTGNVYLTGPYKGAPFGLAIVVHAIAGPFDLGTIVIRAQIQVDPHDLHLTILSDPLPQIRSGIPLRIQTLNLDIARPNFMLNPTNCAAHSTIGTAGSAQGTSFSSTAPFQVDGCSDLPFKPKLTVSTRAKASPGGNGASFSLNVASAPGQANIHSVVVRLPKQLQSRLTTLRTACPAATFDASPSKCPAASAVGSAKIGTQVLASPLTGPVYLVSHGQSGSPELSMVLKGEGITVDLDGVITITKQNVTRGAFDTLPDVPIRSFSLDFPEGPHSLLGENGSLCAKTLAMPTAVTGQSGTQIKQSTTVSVSGCPRKRAKQARVARHGKS